MESHILNQIALAYAPIIDRNRNVSSTRLSMFPLNPSATVDSHSLMQAIAQVWPAGGPSVALNALNEKLVQDILIEQPATHMMIEIPAFMAGEPENIPHILQLHQNGNILLLKGRPFKELPKEVLPCFKHALIDLADDRRQEGSAAPNGITRAISFMQSGIRTIEEMESCFRRGAIAVLGWPIYDALNTNNRPTDQPGLQIIVQLIEQVHKEESLEKLEATLKRDPALAYKLMRYINSPAFGMSVEITSFRHAIMILGYQKLKRWLALLLATASKDVNMRPVMYAAVRRGLLMEELMRISGDEDMCSEIFICGVFSLLDRMFRQSFEDLLKAIPVPEHVYAALAQDSGPYKPYFDLVQAIESNSLDDIRSGAEQLITSFGHINRAILKALGAAGQLE